MMDILNLLIFIIPAYFANSSPVVLGGGTPIDLGKKINGKRILGDGKTIRGFVGGVLAGTLVGFVVSQTYILPYFNPEQFVYVAFLLSLGTMIGDSLGSFIKRRIGIESGRPFVLDTIFFLAVGLAFAYNYAPREYYEIQGILLLFMITLILHPSTNLIANRLGIKKVPW